MVINKIMHIFATIIHYSYHVNFQIIIILTEKNIHYLELLFRIKLRKVTKKKKKKKKKGIIKKEIMK